MINTKPNIDSLLKLVNTSWYPKYEQSEFPLTIEKMKERLDGVSQSIQFDEYGDPLPYSMMIEFITQSKYNEYYSKLIYNLTGIWYSKD